MALIGYITDNTKTKKQTTQPSDNVAVTGVKRLDQTTQPTTANQGSNVSVTKVNGKPVTANKTTNKATTYRPAQTAQPAQAAQQAVQQTAAAAQPQKALGYNSRYGTELDNILAQIQNPGEFKYDFNGDELFKYYADLYAQQGKQASMDAMGQAAALTGGYGNSYAQQVGNQTYDQYLQGLYDKGMEFQNAAYQRFQDNRDNLYNRYNALMAQDQSEYERWQDQRNYALTICQQLLASGKMPTQEMLDAAGLSATDAQNMLATVPVAGGGGGGGGGKKTPDETTPDPTWDLKAESEKDLNNMVNAYATALAQSAAKKPVVKNTVIATPTVTAAKATTPTVNVAQQVGKKRGRALVNDANYWTSIK